MRRILLSAGLLLMSLAAKAQCNAITSLNESFSNFAISNTNAFPQNCWNSIQGGAQTGPWIYTDQTGSPANQYVNFYSFNSANTASYLITPQLSNIDGNHKLSFSTWKPAFNGSVPAGDITVQVGTMTSLTDATTFVAFGNPIPVSAELQTPANIVLPAVEGNAYIAFKFISATIHNAISIDNVVWEEVPNPCPAVTSINETFDNYITGQTQVISQYCWSALTAGTFVYPAAVAGSPAAQFYSFTNPGSAGYLVSPKVNSFDGNHTLTFTAASATGVVLQPGYLTNATDSETFVAVGSPITLAAAPATTYNISNFPVIQGEANIAFRFVAAGQHNTASVDNIVWAETPDPCAAVSSIDENFDNYVTGQTQVISQYCWTALTTGTFVYPAAVAGSPAAQFYSFTNPGSAGYLLSPKVNSFDGNHTLTFTGVSATGVVLQTGYITSGADDATFVAVGDPITLAPAPATTYTVSNFPVIQGEAHIAFRFVAAGQHNTASIDNVKWQTTAGVNTVAAKAFTLYPNPAAGSVNLVNNANAEGTVNIYSLTGAQVFSAKVSTGTQSLNLSGLQAGMYIVRVQTGNALSTQKLVIQ
ncbi:MAG: T9SS type A sorting domain-containing protein [Bacteroidia bacterium]